MKAGHQQPLSRNLSRCQPSQASLVSILKTKTETVDDIAPAAAQAADQVLRNQLNQRRGLSCEKLKQRQYRSPLINNNLFALPSLVKNPIPDSRIGSKLAALDVYNKESRKLRNIHARVLKYSPLGAPVAGAHL
jgi:hypothetical protein